MATKKKTTTKPTLTVEKVETLAPEPVAPTPVGGVNGHIHQWQAGGSIRDGEFIEFCPVCSETKIIRK